MSWPTVRTGLFAVEHIGSTAIPGLTAKPIIDILLGIPNSIVFEHPVPVLVALGYEDLGEAGVPGRRYFRKRTPAAVNVHAVLLGGELWCDNLLLRNFLRANPAEAEEYGAHKARIITDGATHLLHYSERKAAIMQHLLARAHACNKMKRDGSPR